MLVELPGVLAVEDAVFEDGDRRQLVLAEGEAVLGATSAKLRRVGVDGVLQFGRRRIRVAGVVPDGPGDRGGLQEGDLIVSLNAQEVGSRRDLYMNLWRHEPGEPLTFEVMRDNKVRRCEVKGGDRAHFFRQL